MKEQKTIYSLEKKIGWNKIPLSTIISLFRDNARKLSESNVKSRIDELIFQLVQIANRKKVNLSKELRKSIKATKVKFKKK